SWFPNCVAIVRLIILMYSLPSLYIMLAVVLHRHSLPNLICFSAQGGVSLFVPQPNINATVTQNILLSVEYACKGVVTIEWKHVSSWGTNKIVEWKSGNYSNVSKTYKDRVNTYENGSIQLLNVGVRDAGYYVVTITEELGTNIYGTIVLSVYEIIYEDLHFVAVFFAFLTAVSAVLVCFMWFCNKSVHLFQNKRHKLKENNSELVERPPGNFMDVLAA
uniref:V-set and transmembrane domain containing 5 n=1 Tax=Pelusios castaneus TaxID=367368 RepID=A0A8C8RPN3_9SAUR